MKKISVYMGDLEFRFDAATGEWAADQLASELRSIADSISHMARSGQIKVR